MFSPPIAAGEPAIDAVIIIGAAQQMRENTEYYCGPLWLNRSQHRATCNGEPLNLSVSEFRLLARLMERPGDVATTEQLHAAIRSGDADRIEAGNQVRPVIAALRRKLPAGLIENVRGVGYRLAIY